MLCGKKLIITILRLFILVGLEVPTVSSKSVYVISDTQTSELFTYKIDGTNLDYQTDYICEFETMNLQKYLHKTGNYDIMLKRQNVHQI